MGWLINPYRFKLTQSGYIFAGTNDNLGPINKRVAFTKDLINWEETLLTDNNDNHIYYASDYSSSLKRGVILGSRGNYAYSNDLINWTSSNFGNNSFIIRDCVRSEQQDLFIAVGDGGFGIAKSSDGIIWNRINSTEMLCVAYSPTLDKFVTLNQNGGLISSDGTNWSGITLPTSRYQKVIWIDSLNIFYAIGGLSLDGTNFARSSNGINWTASTMPGSGVRNHLSIAYSDVEGIFMLSATLRTVTGTFNRIYTSTNGITWTLRNTTNRFWDLIWSDRLNKFLGCESGGFTSSDGITWVNDIPTYYNNIFNTITEL